LTSSGTVSARAFESGFIASVAVSAAFSVDPLRFTSVSFTNGASHLFFAGAAGKTYLLQASTNLVDWTAIATNVAPAGVFEITDPSATNYPYRFYRAVKLP